MRIYGTVNRFPVELKASEMVEEFFFIKWHIPIPE